MEKQAHFIVFEGIDGAGTTTQSRLLQAYFEKNKIRSALTFEPTDGPIGKLIRQILQGKTSLASPQINNKIMGLLFSADRLDHVDRIGQILDQGSHVITDRYYLSSYAYQSIDQELDWIRRLNQYAITPDFVFFLDISLKTALERISQRDRKPEIYENQAYLEKVNNQYKTLWDKTGDTVYRIDGEQDISVIFNQVQSILGA